MTSFANSKQLEAIKPRKFWPHDLVLGLLPILLGFQILLAVIYLPLGLKGLADFRQLYTGGYMIRAGYAAQLYDYDTQQHFEETLVPVGAHFLLPVNHLAFEELFFVPLSLLHYRTAYLVFLAFNCVLLVACTWLLGRTLKTSVGVPNWLAAVLVVSFCPISRALLQGQDSIILMALGIGAFWLLKQERELAAGCLVGIGMFKFQIAIPIALLFLAWRRWRFSLGFGISSSAAVITSLWIVGLHGARQYVDMLVSMSMRLKSDADILRYCTSPTEMLNVRGLVSAMLTEKVPHTYTQIVILLLSITILGVAARQRPSWPLAVTAAALVSYHFIAHDACILIIVIGAALCARSVFSSFFAIALLIAPFSAMTPALGYMAAVPLLGLFTAMLLANEDSASAPHTSLAGANSYAGN